MSKELAETREEVRAWAIQEPETKDLPEDHLEHIVTCLYHIIRWYKEDCPVGNFLTAVLRNNLRNACFTADDKNRKVLSLYVRFIHWNLPGNYIDKIKEL